MSTRARLSALEDEVARRPCPHCRGLESGAGCRAVFVEGEEPIPPPPRCPRCGREGLQLVFHVRQDAEPEETNHENP